jgi:hypothetical protein
MAARTRFRAPWGRELIVLSAIGVLAIGIATVMAFTRGGWLAGSLLVTILAIPVSQIIRGYEVRRGELIVRRLLWNTRWPLHDRTVASFRPQVMANSWRTWGNGGFFSYSGRFANTALQRYQAFVTDLGRTVVLDTPKGVIVVSPDDPVAFSAAVAGISDSADERST